MSLVMQKFPTTSKLSPLFDPLQPPAATDITYATWFKIPENFTYTPESTNGYFTLGTNNNPSAKFQLALHKASFSGQDSLYVKFLISGSALSTSLFSGTLDPSLYFGKWILAGAVRNQGGVGGELYLIDMLGNVIDETSSVAGDETSTTQTMRYQAWNTVAGVGDGPDYTGIKLAGVAQWYEARTKNDFIDIALNNNVVEDYSSNLLQYWPMFDEGVSTGNSGNDLIYSQFENLGSSGRFAWIRYDDFLWDADNPTTPIRVVNTVVKNNGHTFEIDRTLAGTIYGVRFAKNATPPTNAEIKSGVGSLESIQSTSGLGSAFLDFVTGSSFTEYDYYFLLDAGGDFPLVDSPLRRTTSGGVTITLAGTDSVTLDNHTSINWSWQDFEESNLFVDPTDRGTVLTASPSGEINISLPNSTLTSGQKGTLVLDSFSDGVKRTASYVTEVV